MDIKNSLNNLSEEERKVALSILEEFSKSGESTTFTNLMNDDFDEIPVDIDTFLHNKKYLGNALYDNEGRFTLFPYWEEKLKDIFPTNTTTAFNTIILTGAIGLGKSTLAVICLLYMLYRLLCLKDPYLYYGLQPTDKISISLMNITLENAKGVALDKMNQMLLASEWFMTHGKMSGISNLEYQPDKHIEVVTASSNNQIIGRCLFANFTDEINFALTTDVEKAKRKAKTLISQIDARMKSRFLRGTKLPTLNIIASSKNSEQSFLEEYISIKKKNESKKTLIVDEPQWVVDSRKDSDIKFYVAVGNKFLANELLPLSAPKSLIEEYRAKGYSMLAVPIGYRENFEDNIDGALTDIAGIATASALKYISGVRWNEIKVDTYENPFAQEIIKVGNSKDDFAQYSDFFDLSKVPANLKSKPLYVHLDMSKKGDKTGIGGVYIIGKKPKVEGEDSSRELFYRVAFNVSIEAPKGFEISFDKNRAFIRWLREKGFNIKSVSSDTYQSAQILQQLQADGFNTSTISVDRLDPSTKQCLPYAYFKSTIYDRRLEVYKNCDFLTEEILGLERESDGHINHPENGTQGCFTGDTKVSLVDGREVNLLQLVDEFNNGKVNYVYSFNETTKRIEPGKIVNAWCTRKNASLVEVELDNGEKFRCTPNHKIMLRDGTYKEAQYLQPNDSVMPLYRKYLTKEQTPMYEYRLYYEPIEDKWRFEHRSFCKEKFCETKEIVHHKNCNKKDNSPDNLIYCTREQHGAIHKAMQTGMSSPEAKAKKAHSIKEWHRKNRGTEAYLARSKKLHDATLQHLGRTEEDFKKRQERLEQQHQNGILLNQQSQLRKAKKQAYIRDIENIFNVKWSELTNNQRDSYAVKYQRMNNPETKQRITSSVKQRHTDGKYVNANKALATCNSESKRLRELYPAIDKVKFFEIFGFEYDSLPPNHKPPYVTKYRKILDKTARNHKIRSVTFIPEKEDVYDLTVENNHNFALSAGIFVHNSKDASDAICGSLWNASLHADEFAYDYGETLNAISDVNSSQFNSNANQMVVDFEEALKASYLSNDKSKAKLNDTQNDDIPIGLYANEGLLIW